MALKYNCLSSEPIFHHKLHLIRPSGDRRVHMLAAQPDKSPAEQFVRLASTFQRRLLYGVGSASLVAIGSNFAGITSKKLGLSPKTGRNLKLDALNPIGGYSRCSDVDLGFEFIYPATWVAGQRSLDPPPLDGSKSSNNRRKKDINGPAVAFGPPGSSGELNVSVIVSPVPLNFR
ncbi:PsbP domain-containing protein [Drosera capensis]